MKKHSFSVFLSLVLIVTITIAEENIKEKNLEKNKQKIQIFPPELESHLLNGIEILMTYKNIKTSKKNARILEISLKLSSPSNILKSANPIAYFPEIKKVTHFLIFQRIMTIHNISTLTRFKIILHFRNLYPI